MLNTVSPYGITVIADMSYGAYQERQFSEITVVANTRQALDLEKANKFHYNSRSWHPQPYEGFAVVAMLDENAGNEIVSGYLEGLQRRLAEQVGVENALFLLPRDSFHQTIANTVSSDRYKTTILDRNLDLEFPNIVDHVFRMIGTPVKPPPLYMRLAGLSLFGTAIGVLGIFENVEDYLRVLRFRAGFYGNELLTKLEIGMTRPFIGHITIAYLEKDLDGEQKDRLADTVIQLNNQWQKDLSVNISHCGLRYYQNLSSFVRKDFFPFYSL